MLKERDYSGVIYLLTPIVSKYPGVSVTHDLLGNAYYLKSDFKKAFKFYTAALEIDPNNLKRQELVRRIKEILRQ